MAGGIVLEWSQFGDFDEFSVYRSPSPMTEENLPNPIATGITKMYYVDTSVVPDSEYYYKVSASRGGNILFSDEIKATSSDSFDSYVDDLQPIVWLKFDEAYGEPIIDHGTLAHECSIESPTQATYNGMVLRKDHKGSIGFAINSTTVERAVFTEKPEFTNITKNSHTWFCFHYRTGNTSQNRLFSDNGDGVNKRVIGSVYQFPVNQRSATLVFPLNEIIFTAVVYSVEDNTYRVFQNGVWSDFAYIPPPVSVVANQTFQVPGNLGRHAHYTVRGYLSDLAFFDKAISEEDIEVIYSLGMI